MNFIIKTITSIALMAGAEMILSKIKEKTKKQKEKTCPHCGVVLSDEGKKDEV
jgi:hypothetical protein